MKRDDAMNTASPNGAPQALSHHATSTFVRKGHTVRVFIDQRAGPCVELLDDDDPAPAPHSSTRTTGC